jgi:hypothetical protein
MAGNTGNLIPRKKGENDAQFMVRVHSTIEKKKKAEATKATKAEVPKAFKMGPRRELRKDREPKLEKEKRRPSTKGVEFSFSRGFKRLRA